MSWFDEFSLSLIDFCVYFAVALGFMFGVGRSHWRSASAIPTWFKLASVGIAIAATFAATTYVAQADRNPHAKEKAEFIQSIERFRADLPAKLDARTTMLDMSYSADTDTLVLRYFNHDAVLHEQLLRLSEGELLAAKCAIDSTKSASKMMNQEWTTEHDTLRSISVFIPKGAC